MTFLLFLEISSNLLIKISNSCLTKRYKFVAPPAKNFARPRTTHQLQHCINEQRWSRGHKARGQGQGHKKIRGQGQGQGQGQGHPFRGQTLSRPRTGMLEAKAKDQGHKAQVLSKKKKKKRFSQKFFKRSPLKNVFQTIFQALHKILTFQKIVLSSSRGQANFRGLEASRPRPRPRTSNCVLEDVLEGSTSVNELSLLQQVSLLWIQTKNLSPCKIPTTMYSNRKPFVT